MLIRARDVRGLKNLPGIGKRTAERLVADLCEKVDDLCPVTAAAVERVLDRLAPQAAGGPLPRLEALLRDALRLLASA